MNFLLLFPEFFNYFIKASAFKTLMIHTITINMLICASEENQFHR